MGLVVGSLEKFAKSSIGTNLYKWGTTEKGRRWLCESLPLIETGIATGVRVYATEKQKLNRREKNILQAGHIVPAIFGIGIGSQLNKKVFELGDKIGKHLNSEKVGDVKKIKGAVQVLGPIATTALLMRLILPVATAFVTSCVEEKRNNKKLDVKV